jgi:hypothetical protein
MTEPIIEFYKGSGTDHRGRRLAAIVQKSDKWLEETHDYIQWVFPLSAPSRFNPHAPLLTEAARRVFTDSSHDDHAAVQQNFTTAIRRMLAFYGYSIVLPAGEQIAATSDWPEQANNWLTPGNHNQMRLTRMIRSMHLLGRDALAKSLQRALLHVGKKNPKAVSNRTLEFWRHAA